MVRHITILPGQYWDAETGLHYNWHRYYDPSTGRYISADPIGLEGKDLNLYSYVGNDPINWIDPEGLARIPGIAGEPIYVHPNDVDPFPSTPVKILKKLYQHYTGKGGTDEEMRVHIVSNVALTNKFLKRIADSGESEAVRKAAKRTLKRKTP